MTSSAHLFRDPYAGRDRRVRLTARLVGSVFLLVGVAGFVPGITSDVGDLALAGHESGAELLGLFQVSVLHNVVHLLFGVVGVVFARAPGTAVWYLVGGGLVYLALWVYGVAIDQHGAADVVPLNDADNWLHLGLGLGMVVLGLWARRHWRGTVTPDLA